MKVTLKLLVFAEKNLVYLTMVVERPFGTPSPPRRNLGRSVLTRWWSRWTQLPCLLGSEHFQRWISLFITSNSFSCTTIMTTFSTHYPATRKRLKTLFCRISAYTHMRRWQIWFETYQEVLSEMAAIAPMLETLGYDPNDNEPNYEKV